MSHRLWFPGTSMLREVAVADGLQGVARYVEREVQQAQANGNGVESVDAIYRAVMVAYQMGQRSPEECES